MSGSITLWDADQPGKARREIQAHAPQALYRNHSPEDRAGLRGLAFNPGGSLLVSIGYDNVTRLWDPGTGEMLFELPGCTRAAFTPDGRYLVTQANGAIWVWGE